MESKILEILKETNEEILTYTGNNILDAGIVNSFSFIAMIGDLEDEFGIEIDESILTEEYFGNKDRIINTMISLLKE